MTRNCSCGGQNENCFRCFGRGYYNDNDTEYYLLNSPFKKDSAGSIRNSSQLNSNNTITSHGYSETVKCPYCRKRFTQNMLIIHLNQVHPIHLTKRKKNKRKKNNKIDKKTIFKIPENNFEEIKCYFCNKILLSGRVRLHILREHPDMCGSVGFERCPHCQAFVQIKNINKHIKKQHPDQYIQPNQSNSATDNHNNEFSNVNISNNQPTQGRKIGKRNHTKRFRNIKPLTYKNNDDIHYSSGLGNGGIKDKDGSAGWHTFRDNGKFGSYSSFDSMDDESNP